MTTEIIHRRHDGSLDIDFYRARGLAERRVVISRCFRSIGRLARPAFAVAVLIATLWAMPPLPPTADVNAITLLSSGVRHTD